jgi:DNA-binding YbaB/EbfC family protein
MQPGITPGDPGDLGAFGRQAQQSQQAQQALGDLQSALAQAQHMQQHLLAAQQQIAQTEVQGQAGGGLVEVTLSGQGKVVSVRVDPSVVDPADVETLQDLIIGAFDNAAENMRETVKTILGPLAAAGGRPLPES